MRKRGVLSACVLFALLVLISLDFVYAEVIERGTNWEKISNTGGAYNLKIYNSPINYYNGSSFLPINVTITNSSYLDYEYEMNTPLSLYRVFFQNNLQAGKG